VLSVAQGANEKRMKTHPFLRFADRANSHANSLRDRRSRQQQAGLPGLSYSQALAALGATCVQHGTAAAGCHTSAETMRALAADNGGLVGTFHCGLANQQKINRIITPNAELSKRLPAHADAAEDALRPQQKFQHRGSEP
jgi:hypothetical protein